MSINKFIKKPVLLPALAGTVIGGLLFVLGAYDDAPGMCAAGLSIGFVLIMLGVNKTGVIKKGLLAPILLFCFAAFILLLDTAILIDGEFGGKPWYSAIGFAAAAVLIFTGIFKIHLFMRANSCYDFREAGKK